jgi:hypothetical protein
MDAVVWPLGNHRYAVPGDEDKVTLEPVQNVVGPPALMVAVGAVLTMTWEGADIAEQPRAFVTLTV